MKVTTLIFLVFYTCTWSQISGCTDPLSKNFNAKATINDGSCQYRKTKTKPEFSIQLSDSLVENSTLFYYDSLLWTANDDADPTLYGLNTSGKIEKKITIAGLKNKEWEEISQDDDYLYLGDFGNNSSGNRTDLRLLRLSKKELYSNNIKIDTIAFSYENQSDFSIQQANTTHFDCEAFIVLKDSIYLFTKQYDDKQTSVYVVPKKPGTYPAKLQKTFDVDGLITGATYDKNFKTVVLCGYSKLLQPFIYLLSDFQDTAFFSGNKRKIKVKLPFHQIEGVATPNGLDYYISNEKTVRKPLFNTPQQLHKIYLRDYILNYLVN
ncbi:hypothetical protein FFWV33_09520 [Flavobacterium faecale]|uniref:T9SS C-terminal target domain-containing protein n=1 Tax=Flavobacterium faecale TaxID=1355330 RepID=A0A2S1LDC4_9FLAO|nr:hypothetical protein [Flavobacterium faecale]AWG21763.1 hypothetical protein FFWV33_09520 [Flavobacterium faecale]